MAFSTLTFLVIFLPLSLIGYYLINNKIKNIFLLIVSLLFYICGGAASLPVLAGSTLFNYIIALIMDRACRTKITKRIAMISAVTVNIGLLFCFKYLSYVISASAAIFDTGISAPSWSMPLGISFFTFSSISYILDIYFGTSKSEKNLLDVALFITFFPKMISGPIVKWNTFQSQLADRKFSLDTLSNGVVRFIIGLGKKVIIADTIGVMADYAFNRDNFSELSVLAAWFGVLAYLIQLYFDFSGYSDMAIGIGKMFGFTIDENFDYPYVSKSVVEYWARWHITLGTWLKNYLYTPIFRSLSKKKNSAGKKKFSIKACDTIALLVTWIIIGEWHGAGLKFLIYGLYYFLFILLERKSDNYKKKRAKEGNPVKENFFIKSFLPHIYLIVVVIFGQLLFRANSLSDAFGYLGAMFGMSGAFTSVPDMYYVSQYVLIFFIGVLFSIPWLRISKIPQKIEGTYLGLICDNVGKLLLLGILIVSVAFTVGSTYNAFIYFNF